MTTALAGETIQRPTGIRVPIMISEDAKELLTTLLYQPYMRGVGYSEFIIRACLRTEQEANEQGLDG